MRSGAIVAAGGSVVGGSPSTTGVTKVKSDAATSQVYSSSGMSVPSGGASSTYAFIPVCVLGIPKQRHVAVLGWGDSIMYGSGETGTGDATYGHYGWFDRGLIGVNGYNVPFVNCSRSGDNTRAYTANFSWGRYALLEFVTHAVFGMSTNDVGNGYTLAEIQSNCQAAWAAAKRMGVKVYHTTMTPKTTSTDSWATAANQTVTAEYDTAGKRGQFNAWLLTQVDAGNLDGVIDVNAAVADPANPDKWLTNGTANYLTADGLHPSTSGHVLMAAVLNAAVATWTV